MYDTLRCFLISGSVTLFANVPDMFELPVEKIGFGALLFLIIWTYMKQILPKTHDEMERKNARIAELIQEVHRLNTIREKDQRILESLLREHDKNNKISDSTVESRMKNTQNKRIPLDDPDIDEVQP